MALKNEAAMRDLVKLKSQVAEQWSDYWHGVFIGKSGAYMMAGVITFDQYKSLHNDEAANVTSEVAP